MDSICDPCKAECLTCHFPQQIGCCVQQQANIFNIEIVLCVLVLAAMYLVAYKLVKTFVTPWLNKLFK